MLTLSPRTFATWSRTLFTQSREPTDTQLTTVSAYQIPSLLRILICKLMIRVAGNIRRYNLEIPRLISVLCYDCDDLLDAARGYVRASEVRSSRVQTSRQSPARIINHHSVVHFLFATSELTSVNSTS
jgi:hypothetical protein